jgi:hypothetical protein
MFPQELARHGPRLGVTAIFGVLALTGALLTVPGSASAAVPGLTYVNATTAYNSNVHKSVTVSCPAGTEVVGGGYDLIGAEGSVVLDDFIPNGPSLTVGAGEVVGPGEPSDGTTASWEVTANAVCAVPPPGYQVISGTSAFTRSSSQFASAVCPAGLTAIGAGASLANGWGQISIQGVLRFDTGVDVAAVDDEDGYSGNWSITAYAICISGRLPGLQNVNGSPAVADSSFIKTATAYCPAGQQALGAGWWNFNDSINVDEQVLNIHANVWSGGVTGIASEDADGYGGNWSFTTIVTCADT